MLQITKHFSRKEIETLIKNSIQDELRKKGKLDAILKDSSEIQVTFLEYYEQDENSVVIATINL